MHKYSISVILFCSFLLQIKAQDTLKQVSRLIYQRIDASYVFGGQIYNNNFIYNPGFSFQASYGILLNESVGIGAGVGYYKLQDEHFMPVFVEAVGCRKNKASSPMVKMQLGYSPGWYSGNMQVAGYQFKGGIYIDAGLGRKIPVNKAYSFYFHWSYRHQFARMEYEVFGGQHYTESLNYDMVVITLGIIRHSQ